MEYHTWYGVINVAIKHLACTCGALTAVSSRESTWQLLMHSLDKRVTSSILLLTSMSKNTSRETLIFVLKYLIDYKKSPNRLIHNRKKVNCYWGCYDAMHVDVSDDVYHIWKVVTYTLTNDVSAVITN